MAGNKVTLTFAGEHSDLQQSFDRVGSGAASMGRSVESQSGKLDRLGEAGGTAETRFLGLGAGISGVSTIMSGDAGPEDYAMALADLGDSIEHTVIPLIQGLGTKILTTGANAVTSAAQHVASAATTVAGWVAMGVQSTINGAKMAAAWLIGLGPIGLVIAGIAAVTAILVALGVDFDDVKNAIGAGWRFIQNAASTVFNWLRNNWPLVLAIITGPIGLAVLAITRHWGTIKSGFTAVKNWIRDRVSDVVGIFTGLPGRLAAAASGLWGFITSGFKAAINTVIGWWNGLRIPGFSFHQSLPGPIPDINFDWGGVDLPNIPTLHRGGVFRAPAGQNEGLAMLLNGERVSRPGTDAAGVTVNVYVAGSIRSDRDLVKVIRDEFARGGFS